MHENNGFTPFQLFTIDLKQRNNKLFDGLSVLEIARKIAFQWTQMSQIERRQYYEKAGKHVDKLMSAKIRGLANDDSESRSADENSQIRRKATSSNEQNNSPKRMNSDSHDSDEDEYVAPRRGGRRGRVARSERLSGEDSSELASPRRRASRKKRIFGAP